MKTAVCVLLALLLACGAPSQQPTLTVDTPAALQAVMAETIEQFQQLPVLDVRALGWQGDPAMEMKNQYYKLTSARPDLKYAYDLNAQTDGTLISCKISYMPYKTGMVTQGAPAASLHGLLAVAQANLGSESVALKLTNPALDVDTMWRVLAQVGGGTVACTPNRDFTGLVYQSGADRTMAQALQELEESDRLAAQWVSRLITPGMTEEQKLRALYTELTDTVAYDRRYYDAPGTVPAISRTALGALRDSLAVCGGYAHALEALCMQAGLECYTVSGTMRGESHRWNIVRVDGRWRYYDPTADRNSAKFGFFYYGKTAQEFSTSHVWDQALVELLINPEA